MAVFLSPVGGVAAQFFTNTGAVLTGGKLYTYAAGTTTPAATYTSSVGTIPHTNPIVLDAAGRVPSGGEIWLTDGVIYKFVLKTSNDVLIATYDNITGINSNFVNYTASQEIQTATAGQTVFNLTTMQYTPGTNSLSVYVDGVNQYGPGAQYAYTETDTDTVTFVSGLRVGASVKFTTTAQTTGNATDASVVAFTGFKGQTGVVQDLASDDGSDWIGFLQKGNNAVARSAQDKMRDFVSVRDFGAVGDGVTDDLVSIQAAVDAAAVFGGKAVFIPAGIYRISSSVYMPTYAQFGSTTRYGTPKLFGEGAEASVISNEGTEAAFIYPDAQLDLVTIEDLQIATTTGGGIKLQTDVGGLYINRFFMNGCATNQWAINHIANVVYTCEIVGRFWRDTGYYGGVATFAGGINIHFHDCFISQQWGNKSIIAVSNTKNITLDTIQIEGADSSTTTQKAISINGYCFNLMVNNLYLEGNLDTGISCPGNLVNMNINGLEGFVYGKASPVFIDNAAGSITNGKVSNVVYVNLETSAGTGYIINDPSHTIQLDLNYSNQSSGAQASRKFKQNYDFQPLRGTMYPGNVSSGSAIAGAVYLPSVPGNYWLNVTFTSADNNHSLTTLWWVVWDDVGTSNYTTVQQIGTSVSKGANAPTLVGAGVTTSGVVSVTATSHQTAIYQVHYMWTKMADSVYQ